MRITIGCILIWLLTVANTGADTIPWPVTTVNGIGNNYGAFQKYPGFSPYSHDGLDILTDPGATVYAVADGVVTYVAYREGSTDNGVMLGSPVASGEAYLYWHLDKIHVGYNDNVTAGQAIGTVVEWWQPGFHHVHFSRVRGTGPVVPWAWYEPIANPISLLDPGFADSQKPTIDGVVFFLDAANASFQQPNKLHGRVDVVVSAFDLADGQAWALVPQLLRLTIRPQGSNQTEVISELDLGGALGSAWKQPDILFATKPPTASAGDYVRRAFYFVVTNNDGVAGLTHTDRDAAWDTRAHADGSYVLELLVLDFVGNEQRSTINVKIDNVAN